MPIQVACAHCGKTYNLSEDKAGKRYRCTDCQEPIVVPASAQVDQISCQSQSEESIDDYLEAEPETTETETSSIRRFHRKSVWLAVTFLVMAIALGSFLILRRNNSIRPDDPLAFVPANASMFVMVRPARIASSPLFKSIPRDVFEDATRSIANPLKLDLWKVEFASSVQVLGSANTSSDPLSSVTLMRYTEPLNLEDLLERSKKRMAEVSHQKHNETPYLRLTLFHTSHRFEQIGSNNYQWGSPQTKELLRTAFVSLDDRTFLVGEEKAVLDTLDRQENHKNGLLRDHLRRTLADQDVLIAVTPSLDPDLSRLSQTNFGHFIPLRSQDEVDLIASKVKLATLSIDLSGEKLASLDLIAMDDESADQIHDKTKSYKQSLESQLQLITNRQQDLGNASPAQMAGIKFIGRSVEGFSISRSNKSILLEITNPGGWEELMEGVGPSRQSSRLAARSALGRYRIKQIGLALHNFHDSNNALPPYANLHPDINVHNLSWRVWLLPHMGESQLYDQFHKGEPWDSPHNLKLIDQMPEIYASPDVTETGKTRLLSFSAPDSALGTTRVAFKQIKDGLKNTIAVVEAAPEKAVIWTKPEDLPFDRNDPISALGTIPDEGFLALFVDGSARMIPKSIDAAILKALITIAGGEDVDF